MCPFFEQRGSCRYGNSCKFLYNIPAAGVAESRFCRRDVVEEPAAVTVLATAPLLEEGAHGILP